MNAKQACAVTLTSLGLCLFNAGCNSDSKPASTGRDAGGTGETREGGGGSNANPYVRAGGIGVTDLEKASSFMTDVLGMAQEGSDVTRDDRVERTFYATADQRGSRVVLMKFNDGRNTQDITAKIVFESNDVQGAYDTATAAGYTSILPPYQLGSILVSQVKGPEGYTVEILHGLDDGGAGTTKPYFIALAFGVTDLMASETFYTNAFGMKETVPYSDMDLHEQTMEYPTGGGAGLVLQHYDMTTHNYKDNPVKHVSYVPDVDAFVTRITSAGGTVVQAAAAMPAYGGKRGAVLKDPDGVVIELVAE